MQLILRFARGTVTLCFVAISLASTALAGKYNEVLSIGDPAPRWEKLPDVVSEKGHSLADLKDKTRGRGVLYLQ